MKKELTLSAVFLGLIIGVIMTAANVYLGLYAGMTVSASIPAAVLAMGVYKTFFKGNSIYQSNIVQTMASAGESLAAGVIFTLPALVIVGAWNDFEFWPTTLIAIAGGLLGIIFMIPLRKALIVEDKTLVYPEGVACAAVLKTGTDQDSKGFLNIIWGLVIGAFFKFFTAGLGIFSSSFEFAKKLSQSTFFFGVDLSPALLSVGYIVRLQVAVLVFLGGILGWSLGIPLLGTPSGLEQLSPDQLAWHLWSNEIRYIGVGAMITGGVWSIISVSKGIFSGLKDIKNAYAHGKNGTSYEQKDLGLKTMLLILGFAYAIMVFLYSSLMHSMGLAMITATIMVIASFLFVAVSSYIVGLVGSSNNPVSGMTISALLITALFFLILGYVGDSAILATLGVASVVCCAACTAGDCSQDLKTGAIIGASPYLQQISQVIGVLVPAFVIAPVLTLLHQAYGIGVGLKAPQAMLFASLTKALFGNGYLPKDMVLLGIILGVTIIIVDKVFFKKKSFRLHLMPLAVGIYLPVTLAVPVFLGGLIRYLVELRLKKTYRESQDPGVLMCSGFIAGEAIMGVFVAILLYYQLDIKIFQLPMTWQEILSTLAFLLIALFLYKKSTFLKDQL